MIEVKYIRQRLARAKEQEKKFRAFMESCPPDNDEYDDYVKEVVIVMHEINILEWILNTNSPCRKAATSQRIAT
jgi:hypothetical protein